MMHAWSFSARMVDEIGRLLRALGKNRYVSEVDHQIHWSVDVALGDLPAFAEHARAFEVGRRAGLDLASRDPALWRPATADDVIAALGAFWTPGPEVEARRSRLRDALATAGIEAAEHAPFASDPEVPPFPELVTLDWVLLAVDELDADQHAGALGSLEAHGGEIETPSEPVYIEGPALGLAELCEGAPRGVLERDWEMWADGPFGYVDYLFRGVSKAAKLVDPPIALEETG
jgi:hypothetical protein